MSCPLPPTGPPLGDSLFILSQSEVFVNPFSKLFSSFFCDPRPEGSPLKTAPLFYHAPDRLSTLFFIFFAFPRYAEYFPRFMTTLWL